MHAERSAAIVIEIADAAAVPRLPSGRQDLGQFPEPGPQVSETLGDVHAGEAFHLAATFEFVRQVDHRPFAEGAQRLLVAGREVGEPGYQGGEGAEFIAARPVLTGWVLRASRADSLPKSWHPSQ